MRTSAEVGNLDRPEGLDEAGDRAFDVVASYLGTCGRTNARGCRVFYSPSEWRLLGKQCDTQAHLVVVYSGSLRPVFSVDAAHDLELRIFQMVGRPSPSPYALYEGMKDELEKVGLRFEELAPWYGAVRSRGEGH